MMEFHIQDFFLLFVHISIWCPFLIDFFPIHTDSLVVDPNLATTLLKLKIGFFHNYQPPGDFPILSFKSQILPLHKTPVLPYYNIK